MTRAKRCTQPEHNFTLATISTCKGVFVCECGVGWGWGGVGCDEGWGWV